MSESQIIEISSSDLQCEHLSAHQHQEIWLNAIEHGKVLYLRYLPQKPGRYFGDLGDQAAYASLLDPKFADPTRKNISLQPDGKTLLGLSVAADTKIQAGIQTLIAHYQRHAKQLIDQLLPYYRDKLRNAPTSLRLHPVHARKASWRQDDSRLHVDAFPSRPNQGDRILRVFTNLHPRLPRVWRIGEPFEAVAQRFLPLILIKPYRPQIARWLHALRITKSRRSAYDHLMLHLHDAMKSDPVYQRDCPQQTMLFPPYSTWVCFSDQTSHAAMSGQFMLEQTFFLPVEAMAAPQRSPLGVLTRLTGRKLI